METLLEAKKHLRENFEQGIDCPCCGQFVKLYKRKFNSSMAKSLFEFYKQFRNGVDFFHYSDYLQEQGLSPALNGEFQKLKHFGLIEKMEGKKDDGNKSVGFYRITKKGVDFVEGRIRIPSHFLIFNDKLQGFTPTEITFEQGLGKHFNYLELMRAI